jgi:hypothetical protein
MMTSKLVLLMFAAAIIGSMAVIPAYAEGMRQPSSGKNSLDVVLDPDWNSETTKFRIMFLEPGTDTIHEHQDYNFVITKDGNEVYNAAKSQGASLIHNAEGTLIIPYKFNENGDYSVKITIYGLGLPPIPIADEVVTYNVKVTPEFPAGAIGAIVASLSGVVAISRLKRFN